MNSIELYEALVKGQQIQCFSCKKPYSVEAHSETCDMAHREHWGHEWVSQRVMDLTHKLSTRNLKTEDHPEANNRKPTFGEQQWIMTFPLEDGSKMIIRMGKKGRDLFLGMLTAEEVEDDQFRG